MIVREISIKDVDISEFNTRKDLSGGQYDSTIQDLSKSIERQGLLNPITVFPKPDGRYAIVAGQRRLLACKYLGWSSIPATVRDALTNADATAISLIENVHRADMNPHDKAVAFKALLEKFGDIQSVSRETGVGEKTVRKYIQLLDLATELQEQLAAGEVKNTEALARLAQRLPDHDKQVEVWNRISGFTQDVQQEIIKQVDPDLENLNKLEDQAHEGVFNRVTVHNCPFDCPSIPGPLKKQVASMIETFKARQIKEEI